MDQRGRKKKNIYIYRSVEGGPNEREDSFEMYLRKEGNCEE